MKYVGHFKTIFVVVLFLGQRRDSLEFKQRQQMPQLNQFYGSMTSMGSPAGPMGLVQPGQSMTPPPSLSGSSTNLALGIKNTCMIIYSHSRQT